MRAVAVITALAMSLSVSACSVRPPGSVQPAQLRETSPSRLLVEQLLAGMGFHGITRLTATSVGTGLHGLTAYFQATGTRGDTVYRISGSYDALNGIAIRSLVPTRPT